MIVGAAVAVGVIAALGIYAFGDVEGFSVKDENIAEAAQNSMTMLSNQTDDLETSIVDVVVTPFGEASESKYDRTLSDVSKFIEEIRSNNEIEQTEIIIAVEELNLLWDERYKLAHTEYAKLRHRLDYASDNTERYFKTQSDLTDQISNTKLRAERKSYYATHRGNFSEWQKQANIMFANTEKVMERLNDVNIIIQQQTLEVYFTGLIQEDSFAQVPIELLELDEDLDMFREKTDGINLLFQQSMK